MTINKRVERTIRVDIGDLNNKLRLPMSRRIAAGMKTKCDACGEEITDEYLICGFKQGIPNLKLHEKCTP